MSKLMMKMLADMAGITPDEIAQSVEHFRTVAVQGVALLEKLQEESAANAAALARIEKHLDIPVVELTAPGSEAEPKGQLERQE